MLVGLHTNQLGLAQTLHGLARTLHAIPLHHPFWALHGWTPHGLHIQSVQIFNFGHYMVGLRADSTDSTQSVWTPLGHVGDCKLQLQRQSFQNLGTAVSILMHQETMGVTLLSSHPHQVGYPTRVPGRNSQYPLKTCTEGWAYHHKRLKSLA